MVRTRERARRRTGGLLPKWQPSNNIVKKDQNNSKLKCSCSYSADSGSNSNSPHSAAASSSSSIPKQSAKCCLRQRCASFLNNQRFCDVTFIVGKGELKQRIPAHRVFLSSGSDVFQAMFSECWSPESGEIEIPDVEPPAFLNLLRYLYTDEILLTSETVSETLYVAKKYDILPLEKGCVNYMTKHLNPENAFEVLSQARSYNEQSLMDLSLKVIDKATDVAISASGFSDVDSDSLRMVLERNSLNIREIELFKAVLRWCSAECARRSLPISQESQQLVLKDILPLIRFPLMSLEEISCQVAPAGVLPHENLMSIYCYLSTNPKPPLPFNDLPRFWQKFKVRRFQETATPFSHSTDEEVGQSIEFKVDQDVQFLGVGLYGPVNGPAQYSVRLKLFQGVPWNLINKESDVYIFDKASLVFDVLFKNPIKLKSGAEYKVSASIQGPDSFYGRKGAETVTESLSHGRIINVCFAKKNQRARTTVEKGQIPELIFST